MVTQELDTFEIKIGCELQKAVAGLRIFRVTFLLWCFTWFWWYTTCFFTDFGCRVVDFTETSTKAWINMYLKNVTVSSLARYIFPHLRTYVVVPILEPLRTLIVTQHNLWTELIFAPFWKLYFWGCKQPIRTQPSLLCLIFLYLSFVEKYCCLRCSVINTF
jgi:hypothetical protein